MSSSSSTAATSAGKDEQLKEPRSKKAKTQGAAKPDDRTKTLNVVDELTLAAISGRLKALADQWNIEGTCMETNEYLGDAEEQGQLLHDMKQILEQGHATYQNPFGADDRENFATNFMALNEQERQCFAAKAEASHKEKQPINRDELVSYLLNGPFLPVHVAFVAS